MPERPSIAPYVKIDPATMSVLYRDSWGRIWELPREVFIKERVPELELNLGIWSKVDPVKAARRLKEAAPQLWRLKGRQG